MDISRRVVPSLVPSGTTACQPSHSAIALRQALLRLTSGEVSRFLLTRALKANVGALLHGVSFDKKLHDKAFNASTKHLDHPK
jgi:hypothetical protein